MLTLGEYADFLVWKRKKLKVKLFKEKKALSKIDGGLNYLIKFTKEIHIKLIQIKLNKRKEIYRIF